jgi:G3E family GTPase
MARAQYVMIGGFLGAGKTTAMLKLGQHVAATGRRVGLITNDQSSGLADTTVLGSAGFRVEEITGGCFCCRFGSLMDAAERLTQDAAPEVFLAEPVGSCTDLKATVSYPLRRMYGGDYRVAPFSVMVDPARALRVRGLEEGRRFSAKVHYVYEKQLEEADFIVINKIDSVSAERVGALRAALEARYPRAGIFEVSARTGRGLSAWFDAMLAMSDEGRADLEIDYDEYAEGEARLGWLNCTARLEGEPFDGNAWLKNLAAAIQAHLGESEIEIAHLKMTLTSPDAPDELAALNLARTDALPEASYRLQAPIDEGELIVNLRAEGDPDLLREVVLTSIHQRAAETAPRATIEHVEHFRPGRPVPTHRVVLS